jgi:hypothetical protein
VKKVLIMAEIAQMTPNALHDRGIVYAVKDI